MHYTEFFKDKTVTLMGLGLLGRGIGDAAFLAKHCARVIVTDRKTEAELWEAIHALGDFSNIEFVLGGHNEKDFEGVDLVIKGAGVRKDNKYIAHAITSGVPVYMSTALFVKLSGIKTVGVTGTRGKSTTTEMIYNILCRSGFKALKGGNIRGISTLSMLPLADAHDLAVLELDSWQLQGFDDLNISPNVSVFTCLYPDHMDYYDNDINSYIHDKTSIFRHQKPGDTLITSLEVSQLVSAYRQAHLGSWKIVGPLPVGYDLGVPGAHNRENAAKAMLASKLLGVSDEVIDASLQEFSGVEGRLEFLGRVRDRYFVNDTNATTQEATLAGLRCFPPEKIVLVFGGADKGLPIDELVKFVVDNSVRAIALRGTGTDRLLRDIPQLLIASSMSDAVEKALQLSKPEDVILLSPGFASFGMFTNEYDRGDQFKQAFLSLQK